MLANVPVIIDKTFGHMSHYISAAGDYTKVFRANYSRDFSFIQNIFIQDCRRISRMRVFLVLLSGRLLLPPPPLTGEQYGKLYPNYP